MININISYIVNSGYTYVQTQLRQKGVYACRLVTKNTRTSSPDKRNKRESKIKAPSPRTL